MIMPRRILSCLFIFLLCNSVFLFILLPWHTGLKIIAILLLFAGYLWSCLRTVPATEPEPKLRRLAGGCELLLRIGTCYLLQIFFYLWVIFLSPLSFSPAVWVANSLLFFTLQGLLLGIALVRLFISSSQLTALHRIQLVMLWFVPIANLFIFWQLYHIASGEYTFLSARHKRNAGRKEQNVCQTKYPLLMVHGIFFRDWEAFNYWGRIPAELEANGAQIFYGKQQSSGTVETSAGEIKESILAILKEHNCEKLNIIAHSKGGLDCRYAISQLGMGDYVASLTTINTPHRGCLFARNALDTLPAGLVSKISGLYGKLFSTLGDKDPDFYSGVQELTDKACAQLNEILPDDPRVLYRSVGSKMKSSGSAIFPLSLSYQIIFPLEGDNDGLVSTSSMPWGESYQQVDPVGKLGISHGDMIDLSRKNIPGFDVCEFYVGLVSQLKERGL